MALDTENALERARKLLALGAQLGPDGNPTAEADAATAKAAKLIAEYGLEEALKSARSDERQVPGKKKFNVPAQYTNAWRHLVHSIARGSRCKGISFQGGQYYDPDTLSVRRRPSYVEVSGYASDLEIVELLFTSLTQQVTTKFRRLSGYSAGESKSLRNSFLLGFADEIETRLQLANREAQKDSEASGETGAELVLANRQDAVEAYFKAEYPHTRNTRTTVGSQAGYEAGRHAGREANLHTSSGVGRAVQRQIG